MATFRPFDVASFAQALLERRHEVRALLMRPAVDSSRRRRSRCSSCSESPRRRSGRCADLLVKRITFCCNANVRFWPQLSKRRNYEECIGAKKHLVLGLSSHGPKVGSTAFAHGG